MWKVERYLKKYYRKPGRFQLEFHWEVFREILAGFHITWRNSNRTIDSIWTHLAGIFEETSAEVLGEIDEKTLVEILWEISEDIAWRIWQKKSKGFIKKFQYSFIFGRVTREVVTGRVYNDFKSKFWRVHFEVVFKYCFGEIHVRS